MHLIAVSTGLLVLLAAPAYAKTKEPSLSEKAGQTLFISIDGSEAAKALPAISGGVGGIQLQWGSFSLEDTRQLTDKLQAEAEKSRNLPLFIATDYEGGSVFSPTTLGLAELPTNMMLGAARDENNTASLFYLAGRELKRAGINMLFGPVLDVNTNPANPIIGIRSIGDNARLVTTIGAAILNGLKAAKIIAVAKHFPGHGAAEEDSHKLEPVISIPLTALIKEHLPPFENAIGLNIPAIMTAHILFPALDKANPATLSRAILTKLLKQQMGYKGLVITDSLDMKAITSKHRIGKAAALAIKAGADIALIGQGDFTKARDEIVKQVKNGTIPESRLNDAYNKILKTKQNAGLFITEATPSPFDKAYIAVSSELSRKALTLVTNQAAIVPLKSKKTKTAIIIFAPPRFSENALALYKELTSQGYAVEQSVFEINPDKKTTASAILAAKKAETLILGSFQWARSQNINQQATIKAILKLGKPTIVISLMSPYDLPHYKNAGALIAAYGMTAPSMAAAGEILTGRLVPKGLLPITLPTLP